MTTAQQFKTVDMIITAPKADYREDAGNAEIKYLKLKNRQLQEENKTLLAMLAEAIGNRTICIKEETLERKPHFILDENIGGDVLISLA